MILSCICLGSLPAQKTWVVDASNGAGTNFKDLPAALTAARNGDRIIVRKGSYSVATTSKGLRLIGEPGAILGRTNVVKNFILKDLAKGQRFSMQGFRFEGTTVWLGTRYLLELRSCKGQVHLADLVVNGSPLRHQSLYVSACDSVTMHSCMWKPGAVFENSHVSCSNSSFSGNHYPNGSPGVGISCYKSTLELTQCSVQGSNGGGHAPSVAGLRTSFSRLVIRGDKFSRYVGGVYGQSFFSPSLQDDGNNQLELDPSVTISPALKGFPKKVVRRMPALTSTGGSLGSSLKVRLYSPKGDLYLLLGSTPMPTLHIPGLGDTWMAAAPLFVIGSGIQGASQVSQHAIPVPKLPALRGAAIVLQAITASSSRVELSNPSVPVLH